MILTEDLSKLYGDFLAVDGVSLEIESGQVLALLGPNGAGKTTTIRMLTSVLRPSRGWARVAGYDVVQNPSQVRAAVGVLTEQHGLYNRMPAIEYLDFFGQVYGMESNIRQKRIRKILGRFGLWDERGRKIAEYSKGMRQKLALIRAMLHDPEVLLLDEPTSAMDPHSAKQVRDVIRGLRREWRTVLLCTHNLTEAELLADQIAIIRQGEIVALNSPEHLKAQLLGPPLMEVKLAHPLDGYLPELSDLVQIEGAGEDWFHYRTSSPELVNPALLARLAGLDAKVLTLSEVPRSLEDVYLQIVGGEDKHGR
jgi:ABC-2 type transport system ATP-binding protein